MADFDIENPAVPTRGQKQFGALVILFCIPCEYLLGKWGHSLDETVTRTGILDSPLTTIIVGIGRGLSDFWYVAPAIAIALYAAWISRTANRIIWFNAILSIAVPLAVMIFWLGYSAQMSAIQEALIKKWHVAPY